MADAPEELWNVIAGYLEAERLELDDVEILGSHNKGRIVRVTVDEVGLERLTDLSRGVSRLLDEHDVVAGAYTLELSSPGLERKLRRPSHWKKVIGREVTVKTRDEIDGARRHDGMVVGAGDESADIEVEGVSRHIPYAQVTSARTVFRWEKAGKPGQNR